MMKQLMIFISFILSFHSCRQSGMNEKLIREISSDYSRHSYYISVKVKHGAGEGYYVITNSDLNWYFKKERGFDNVKYESYLASVIKKNTLLDINEQNLIKYNFNKVIVSDSLNSVIQLGKDSVIANYFAKVSSNYILKKDLSMDEMHFLVYTLLGWNIISRTDDETGYLIINEKQLAN